MQSKKALGTHNDKLLFSLCFWASGYQNCIASGEFITFKEGHAEFTAINISKDIDYQKQKVRVLIKRYNQDLHDRYVTHYNIPFLHFLKLVPKDFLKLWQFYTMKSKCPDYYSLKLVPSAAMKEKIKDDPMFNNATEKLDSELKEFDLRMDRIGAVKIRKEIHDPGDKIEMSEDFDVCIAEL